jgi:hypothetical protein
MVMSSQLFYHKRKFHREKKYRCFWFFQKSWKKQFLKSSLYSFEVMLFCLIGLCLPSFAGRTRYYEVLFCVIYWLGIVESSFMYVLLPRLIILWSFHTLLSWISPCGFWFSELYRLKESFNPCLLHV